jgi:hypothetical protein
MNNKPIFLYGTGRCASTYFQRLITLKTNAWIWGEHDGMLTPILGGYMQAKNSRLIEQLIFANSHASGDKELINNMTSERKMLSWLNNFTAEDLRTATAHYIKLLLASKLPEGWDEWGFKEIRYGNNNVVPELLFDVFPSSRAGFTFRDPEVTIDSMIRNWSDQFDTNKENPATMKEKIKNITTLWRNIMDYFLKLKDSERIDLVFLTIDSKVSVESIFDKLNLTLRPNANEFYVGKTNIDTKVKTDVYNEIFRDSYNNHRSELNDYYMRAMEYAEK